MGEGHPLSVYTFSTFCFTIDVTLVSLGPCGVITLGSFATASVASGEVSGGGALIIAGIPVANPIALRAASSFSIVSGGMTGCVTSDFGKKSSEVSFESNQSGGSYFGASSFFFGFGILTMFSSTNLCLYRSI